MNEPMSERRVDRQVRVSGVADSLDEALAHVVQAIDAEGHTAPHIAICPVWWFNPNGGIDTDTGNVGQSQLRFEWSVMGAVTAVQGSETQVAPPTG